MHQKRVSQIIIKGEIDVLLLLNTRFTHLSNFFGRGGFALKLIYFFFSTSLL